MKKIISLALIFLAGIVPQVVFAQWNVEDLTEFGLPEASVIDIVLAVMQWLLYAVGFIAIISFSISGILYLTSAGDDNQIERAKKGMTYAIIGTIVAIGGLTAIYFADNLLNGLNNF